MDVYDRCINLGETNLADIITIYGRGREVFRPLCGLWGVWHASKTTYFSFNSSKTPAGSNLGEHYQIL